MNMKTKITLIMTILIASASMAFAQDNDPWVGTWEGIESILGPDGDFQNKTIVRISKHGDDYDVRVKLFSIDNPSKVKYWNDCIITYCDKSTMKWYSYASTSFDWDNTYENGEKVYSAIYTWKVSATNINGRITLEKKLHVDYRNKNNSIIGGWDMPSSQITLRKQESDW